MGILSFTLATGLVSMATIITDGWKLVGQWNVSCNLCIASECLGTRGSQTWLSHWATVWQGGILSVNKQKYSTAKSSRIRELNTCQSFFCCCMGNLMTASGGTLQFAKFNSPSTFLAIQCYNLAHFLAIPSFSHQQLQIVCMGVGRRGGGDGKNSKGLFSSDKRQSFVN